MNIGIVGLGLIGGSFAKGFKKNNNHKVFGLDSDENIISKAKLIKAIDAPLDNKIISSCDFIIITTYPTAAISFLNEYGKLINKNTIVFDCCGTKTKICLEGFKIAEKYGFKFVGGHPMAGTQFSGLKYSKNDMFKNANMILVPPKNEDIGTLEKIKNLIIEIGFKSVTISSPEKHDKIIAYTSQLAHIVSNAYVKSPNSRIHKGFSAGSYKDLTRVAKLNPTMWTELFMENKENLLTELENIIDHLTQYKDAIEKNDHKELYNLLLEGTLLKEEENANN